MLPMSTRKIGPLTAEQVVGAVVAAVVWAMVIASAWTLAR